MHFVPKHGIDVRMLNWAITICSNKSYFLKN